MYVDESGDTSALEQGGSRVLALSGCIFKESDKQGIEEELRKIKKRYYQDPDIEIKSNYLRYANPSIKDPLKKSPIKLYEQKMYDSLQKDIQEYLKSLPITLISIVIDKKKYWERYPAQNPYSAAYVFLLERFQTFLQFNEALGLCVVDPREGGVTNKRKMDKELNDTHQLLRWEKGGFWKPCPRIIEKILFSDSALTAGIQIADLYCYPIFHLFQYNKKSGEYQWFDEISWPKLYFHGNIKNEEDVFVPQILGTGLKCFPDVTKKDFRSFE